LNIVYALALPAKDVRAIVASPTNPFKDKTEAVAPIAELAARRLFGEGGSAWLSIAVGAMLLSSLSAYVLTGPRVIYAMAVAGQFPSVAGRLSARAGTPVLATFLQVGTTLAMLWAGKFESLVVYASVGLSLFSMLAIGAVFVLRWKRPDLPRPFRTPGYPFTPIFYLFVTYELTRAAFQLRPAESLYALGSILLGIPLFYLWERLRVPRKEGGPGRRT
jgi:APA family basic amino acid/polyamine antiporter